MTPDIQKRGVILCSLSNKNDIYIKFIMICLPFKLNVMSIDDQCVCQESLLYSRPRSVMFVGKHFLKSFFSSMYCGFEKCHEMVQNCVNQCISVNKHGNFTFLDIIRLIYFILVMEFLKYIVHIQFIYVVCFFILLRIV